MSSESSSLSNVNDLHSSHQQQQQQQQQQHHHHHHHAGASSSFHPPPAPYLSSGYGSYIAAGMGGISSDSANGMSGAEMGMSNFTPMRNPLKRQGDDLDSLGAGRLSPRERERERERQRNISGPTPYMTGTPTLGSGGDGPLTPAQTGFMPISTSDSRFRGYGQAHGTPNSLGAAPPMSTPFNFTPRSPYDSSLGGNSLMNTPASHQPHSYQHSHSQSYSQHSDHGVHAHNHGNFAPTSTPPPASMGVPTGVPDFMRSSHGPPSMGGADHSQAPHLPPHYGHQNGGFEHDPYHATRAGPSTPMQMPGPTPSQPVSAVPEGAPRASLEIEGDLERQVFGWDHEEWTNGRRLLQFWRRQEGTTIHVSFKNVLQREYDQPEGPRGIIISCIFRPDKNECFITSVDLIYLLESLINNRFTVEEKNRIRRNLEGFRPITISKNKPDCSAFFKRIMGFPAPKPRNIEKDVKVFAWASLRPALCKIVGKYYASYTPGSAGGPAPGLSMGQELGGAAAIGTPGSSSTGAGGFSGMSGSASMPLGVVGVASRTPSLEQQIHRGGSGASGRSPANGGAGVSVLQGSPLGGNANSSLPGPAMGAMSSLGSSASAGAYSHSHPLSLQGGAYGDYHAPHSAASTPTTGQGGPASTSAFYADYMHPQPAYAHDHSGLNSLSGTPAMTSVSGLGASGGGPSSGHPRVASGSSSNAPSSTAGGIGLGLGPSPMPPPSSSSHTTHGSNYVYSPSATGGGGGPTGVSSAYNPSAMLNSITGANMSSSGSANSLAAGGGGGGGGGGAGPTGPSSSAHAGSGGHAHSGSASGGHFPVPVIGGVSDDVSHDFASGILPAPQPGRARGLSASLAAASSTGFRRS